MNSAILLLAFNVEEHFGHVTPLLTAHFARSQQSCRTQRGLDLCFVVRDRKQDLAGQTRWSDAGAAPLGENPPGIRYRKRLLELTGRGGETGGVTANTFRASLSQVAGKKSGRPNH